MGIKLSTNSKNGNKAIKKLKEIEPARAVSAPFDDAHDIEFQQLVHGKALEAWNVNKAKKSDDLFYAR